MADLEALRDELRKGEAEDEQAKRQGDADVRELRDLLRNSDYRTRMHAALDRCLDWHARRKSCVGDRGIARDLFWDDFAQGQKS